MKLRQIKYLLPLTACLFTLLFLSCAVPTRQPSYFDKHPNVLKKQYTTDEIAALEKNLEANPLQYSQAVGDLLLWQMHQKSPEFALEFAQTPEIADGIDAQEVKAMRSIYGLVEGITISSNLFKQRAYDEKGVHYFTLEWKGNTETKSDFEDLFLAIDNTHNPGASTNEVPKMPV